MGIWTTLFGENHTEVVKEKSPSLALRDRMNAVSKATVEHLVNPDDYQHGTPTYMVKKPMTDHSKVVNPHKGKSAQQIIQEIHDSYDNATNALLEEANEILRKASGINVQKAQRLASLGFTSTAVAKESEKVLKDKKESDERAALINHYRTYYPNNKFITLEQVRAINSKYGLVCVKAQNYTADIPDKNLAEIEAFKIRPEDELYKYTELDKWGREHEDLSLEELKSVLEDQDGYIQQMYKDKHGTLAYPLFISCPKKDAILERGHHYNADGFQEKDVKDPIVLKKVKGGFLILSKWGLEGQDPSLTNEAMN